MPVIFALLAFRNILPAAPISEKRVEDLFRPFLAQEMTMSPDGRHIAYSQHSGHELNVVIIDLDDAGRKRTIAVDEALEIPNSTDRQPAQLRFLRWATPTRLVFAPAVRRLPGAVRGGAPVIRAPIMAIDADGKNPKTLTDAVDFTTYPEIGQARTNPPEILAFAPDSRDHLLIRVLGFSGRPPGFSGHANALPTPEATRVFRLNVHSGKITPVNSEGIILPTIYDRQGQPRLLLEGGNSRRREISYLYRKPGSDRWAPLSEVAPNAPVARFLITPENYLGERAFPLGFTPDPNLLLYASNLGRDTFGVYVLNLTTMQPGAFRLEHPTRDLAPVDRSTEPRGLVFDDLRQQFVGIRTTDTPEMTVWLDLELGHLQRTLNLQFPDQTVTIREWNADRTRFLVNVTGGTEPGRVFVLKREEKNLVEIARHAPWIDPATLHETRYVEFGGPDGSTLSGYLTLPRHPRIRPTPLVISFADGIPARPHPEFDREAQVLADLGLVVFRLNQRGIVGRGLKQREALRSGFDQAAVADATAVIEWVNTQHPVDRKRVVTHGAGFGGYLAVRATQLAPELFRCSFITQPLLDLAASVRPAADLNAGPPSFDQEANRIYFERTVTNLNEIGVTTHADSLRHPIFVVYRSGQADTIAQGVGRLRGQLRSRGIPHETMDVNEDYFLGLPKARTKVYQALDEFLNLNLYNYDVKVGPTEVMK